MTDDAQRSDSDLALQAQAGDHRAFDQLVQRHKGPLYHFVRRYVGMADDAYDILQDTFISAWTALQRYDQSKPFSTWLRAIALNKCRDFGRRQAVRRRLQRLVAIFELDPPVQQPEIQQDANQHEAKRLQRLDQAIADLPPFYKEPLLLTTVSGLSHEQTATQLKTTAKAIEMRIRRAKKKLAIALSDLKTTE